MSKPTMTVVIPWCRRPEIEHALRQNGPVFTRMDADVVIINCAGDATDLRQRIASSGISRVRQIDVPAPSFSRSLALNLGLACASADTTLMLDADMLLTEPLSLEPLTSAQDACFVLFKGVADDPPVALRPPRTSHLETVRLEHCWTFVWPDGTSTKVEGGAEDYGRGCRLAPGLMLVRTHHLRRIGGYRSDFVGWGWEDLDVQLRLQRQLGLTPRYVSDTVVHLAHGDDLRDLQGRTRGSTNVENLIRACRAYAAGDFTGTYEADIEMWRSVLGHAPSAVADAGVNVE